MDEADFKIIAWVVTCLTALVIVIIVTVHDYQVKKLQSITTEQHVHECVIVPNDYTSQRKGI